MARLISSKVFPHDVEQLEKEKIKQWFNSKSMALKKGKFARPEWFKADDPHCFLFSPDSSDSSNSFDEGPHASSTSSNLTVAISPTFLIDPTDSNTDLTCSDARLFSENEEDYKEQDDNEEHDEMEVQDSDDNTKTQDVPQLVSPKISWSRMFQELISKASSSTTTSTSNKRARRF